MNGSASTEVLIIEPGRTERHYWRDLWRYRELVYFLARRDVAVRYKQAFFGVAWALVRPIATMLVFTLVFGRIAKLPSEGAPYSLLVLSGMLPWFFFAGAVSEGSQSLVLNSNLLSKVYFPRLAVPVSSIAVALVDLAIGLAVLLVLMAFFGYWPSWRLVFVPLFILLALASALGLALWFSALNVKYRDFQFVVPFAVLFGLYVSPIGFSTTVVPEQWRLLYSLNPMVGVIDGCRWAFLGGDFVLRADALALSFVLGVVLLATGFWFFRRTERSFADVI